MIPKHWFLTLTLVSSIVFAKSELVSQTLPDAIRKSGIEDTIGTTVETSNDGGSTAFPGLESHTYWVTKHTFTRVTDSWNLRRAEDAADFGGVPPIISGTLMRMIRNEYLHLVQNLLPELNEAGGYSSSEVKSIRLAIAPSEAEAEEYRKSGKEDLNGMAFPNPHLAKKLNEYYDDLFLEEKKSPTPLFNRVMGNRLRGGGAPILGFTKSFSRLGIEVVDKSTGQLVEAPEISLTFGRKGVTNTASSVFYFNPAEVRIPAGKWILKVEAAGYTMAPEELKLELRKGERTAKTISLVKTEIEDPSDAKTPAEMPRGRGSDRDQRAPREDALREVYKSKLGVGAVIPYDPRAALDRFAGLPANLSKSFKTYPLLAQMETIAWKKRGRSVTTSSGVAGNPNPAINDPCLNIRFEEGDLEETYVGAVFESFIDDLKYAVVQWANAAYGESDYAYTRLGTFSINGSFYAQLKLRAEHERKESPLIPLGAESRNSMLPAIDFVEWGPADYEKLASVDGSGLGPIDDEIDVTVRFVSEFSFDPPHPDALAAFTVLDGESPKNLIEIRCAENWSLLTGDGKVHGVSQTVWSFRAAILHELGHYFGLRHLPEPRQNQSGYLSNCVMRSSCSEGCDFVTPIDAMMMRYFEYQPIQLRGNACGGLLAK